MSTVITVQGSFTAWHPAERATAHLAVSFDGADRAEVLELATRSVQTVIETVTALHDPDAGPVTWYSSDRIRVWAQRPWNSEGKQLAPVHHAAINVTVKFADFDVLAEWIGRVAVIPGVQIGGIDWDLTEERRTSLTTEVRSRAVQDAADKARVFAQAIGLEQVTAVAIADPGMLGVSGRRHLPEPTIVHAAGAYGGGGDAILDFTPEEIEVSASVDARFEAS